MSTRYTWPARDRCALPCPASTSILYLNFYHMLPSLIASCALVEAPPKNESCPIVRSARRTDLTVPRIVTCNQIANLQPMQQSHEPGTTEICITQAVSSMRRCDLVIVSEAWQGSLGHFQGLNPCRSKVRFDYDPFHPQSLSVQR